MESLFLGGMFIAIAVFILGVAIALALPMLWYHSGQISKKLSKVIELLEEQKKQQEKPAGQL